MKKLYQLLFILGGIFLYAGTVHALAVFYPTQGGTGTSTLPSYGNLLIGGKNGEYEFVASSTFGGGGGGSGTVTSVSTTFPITGGTITTTGTIGFNGLSTSSPFTAGQLAEVSSGNKVFGVSTTSVSAGTGLTGTLTTLGSADSIALSVPVSIANGGTGSTTDVVSQLFYGGASAYQSVATTTASNGTDISITGTGALVGGTGLTINVSPNTISGIALGSNLDSLSNDGATLSGSSFNGSATVSNWAINLANSNTWSVLQKLFGNASSTEESSNQAWFGGTGTTTINALGALGIASSTPNFAFSLGTGASGFYISSTTGEVVGYDKSNAWAGQISPTHSFTLQQGTTTTWTGTSSAPYADYVPLPWSGSLRDIYCYTNTSFLGINIQIAGTSITPSYFIASSTAGIYSITANNTFTKGQVLSFFAGTTTTATTLSVSCTLDATQTP